MMMTVNPLFPSPDGTATRRAALLVYDRRAGWSCAVLDARDRLATSI